MDQHRKLGCMLIQLKLKKIRKRQERINFAQINFIYSGRKLLKRVRAILVKIILALRLNSGLQAYDTKILRANLD